MTFLCQFDLLDFALQQLSFFDGCLPVLTLTEQLLDQGFGELLSLSVRIYRQWNLRN